MDKEYIEREAALSHPFANGHYDHEHAPEDFILGYESYKEWLEQLPAADVRPVVRGRWIGIDEFPYEDWECSVCGEQLCGNDSIPQDIHFCPNCGADMREVDDED